MIEEHGMKVSDLTRDQLMELINKERIYGTVFVVKDKEGNIKIVGLGENE